MSIRGQGKFSYCIKSYESRKAETKIGLILDFQAKQKTAMFASNYSLPKSKVPGFIILNADDWGYDEVTTNRILKCVERGAISSVSAMVFMEDSDRAAALARERGIEAGLHLNLTSPFSVSGCSWRLLERHREVAGYLLRHRMAQALFHPRLMSSFEYIVAAQLEEFSRLYGTAAVRVDGHHHMHLCANVLWGGLLPEGALVRRNFSFQGNEKSFINRFYRRFVDGLLSRRYLLVDYFFSLQPIEVPGRLEAICSLASEYVVEIETHPANLAEYLFLSEGELARRVEGVRISSPSGIVKRRGGCS